MIEVLKQALEAMKKGVDGQTSIEMDEAITSIKEAIREHAMYEVQRLGQDIEQEPVCPDCKAKVLYECVACSSNNYPPQRTEQNFCQRCGKRTNDIHTCTPPQRTEQEPVQVSPLEFVEMVMEKEHLIGKPIFWAEWPNQEKNT